MKNRLEVLPGCLLCLLMIVAGYFGATAATDSIYAFRSPLGSKTPAPGFPLGEPATRRVVLVIIDGLRLDTSLDSETMPAINILRRSGASAAMHSQPPSFSQPGYATLLTGAWPNLNDGPAFNLDPDKIPQLTQRTIFDSIWNNHMKTAVAAYYWFDRLLPDGVVNDSFYTEGDDRAADEEVMAAALPWLAENRHGLVLIHLDQVDDADHNEGGPLSEGGKAAAARADEMLGKIMLALDPAQDTLIVVSDHGHVNQGGHGGPESAALTEPLVMGGKGIKPGAYGDVQMVDVAPTITTLLGAPLPSATQGRVLTEMLDLTPSVLARLPEATAIQQTALVELYTAAIGSRIPADQFPVGVEVAPYQQALTRAQQARLTPERLGRGLLALMVIGLGAVLIYRRRRTLTRWHALGLLLYLIIFHAGYLLVERRNYSFSTFPDTSVFLTQSAVKVALGVLAAWLLVMLTTGGLKHGAGQAARRTLGMVWLLFYLLLLPLAFSFALNGLTVAWILPEFFSFFQGFLSLIQMLFVGAVGLLLTGLAALIARLVPHEGRS